MMRSLCLIASIASIAALGSMRMLSSSSHLRNPAATSISSSLAYGRSSLSSSLRLKKPEAEEDDWEYLKKAWEEESKEPYKGPGPIYEQGTYATRAIAAAAYLVPVVDAADLGKYMFEAYPRIAEYYNTFFGPLSAIYNGVPFLPFAVFFLLSYVCRAPTFPVEIRFHVAQAFMMSLFQFVPSLLFGLLEKGGVPGMGVLYNTAFTWVLGSAFFMAGTLLNPFGAKNPFLLNVVGLSMRYMGYTTDMAPKKK